MFPVLTPIEFEVSHMKSMRRIEIFSFVSSG